MEIRLNEVIFENNMASSGGGVMIYQSFGSVIRFGQYENVRYKSNRGDIGPGLRYLGEENNILKIQVEELSNGENNIGDIYSEQFSFGYKQNERRIGNDSMKFDLCPEGTELIKGGGLTCNRCHLKGVCSGGYVFTHPE